MSRKKHLSEEEKLLRWLAEREIDRALDISQETAAPASSFYTIASARAAAFAPGDVAILKPAARAPTWGPVYALLLEKTGDAQWLIIPFSRYSCPAVPGEWQTPLIAAPLRVLCFWNTRLSAESQLLAGAVKKIRAKLLQSIRCAHESFFSPKRGKKDLNHFFGPRLIHPADPRYEYLDEERERIDAHVPALLSVREEGLGNAWLMAAEGRPLYGHNED